MLPLGRHIHGLAGAQVSCGLESSGRAQRLVSHGLTHRDRSVRKARTDSSQWNRRGKHCGEPKANTD